MRVFSAGTHGAKVDAWTRVIPLSQGMLKLHLVLLAAVGLDLLFSY